MDAPATHRPCPYCAEPIRADAALCRFCGSPLSASGPAASTHPLAIASLVLGVVWIWWIGSLLALYFGYRARREMARADKPMEGAGLAVAGIVLGWVGVGFLGLTAIGWLITSGVFKWLLLIALPAAGALVAAWLIARRTPLPDGNDDPDNDPDDNLDEDPYDDLDEPPSVRELTITELDATREAPALTEIRPSRALTETREAPSIGPRFTAMQPATFGERLLARLIDTGVLAAVDVVILVVLALFLGTLGVAAGGGFAPAAGIGLLLYLLFGLPVTGAAIAFVYYPWLEARTGATIGKRIMGLRVVDAHRPSRIGTGRMIVRHLAHGVAALPVGVGLLACLWDPERRAWHDRMTGTRVVRALHGPQPSIAGLVRSTAVIAAVATCAVVAVPSAIVLAAGGRNAVQSIEEVQPLVDPRAPQQTSYPKSEDIPEWVEVPESDLDPVTSGPEATPGTEPRHNAAAPAAPRPEPTPDPVRGRTLVDRPDQSGLPQVHVMYAVPSDGVDRRLDVDGTIANSVAPAFRWFEEKAGRPLRLDRFELGPDVTFHRLRRTDAEYAAQGPYVRDAIEAELDQAGFDEPDKVYAVYYEGTSTHACGGGAWPPDLPGNVAVLYLKGTPPDAPPCQNNPFDSVEAGYWEFSLLHEIVHTLGFVARCGANHTEDGHVDDDPRDLMYRGDAPWQPSVLDAGNDDYFNLGRSDCADLARSPYLGR